MNDSAHRNVPIGTITDHDGDPVTIRRDYDTIDLPGCTIARDQFPLLRRILDDAEKDIIACEAEMTEAAQEAASRPEGTCTYCHEHITLLGGSWTCDEGTIVCLPTSPSFTPHKPKGN